MHVDRDNSREQRGIGTHVAYLKAVLCACVACKGCIGGSEMIRNYAVWIIYGYIDAANSYNYIQRYIIIYSKIRIII